LFSNGFISIFWVGWWLRRWRRGGSGVEIKYNKKILVIKSGAEILFIINYFIIISIN